MQLGEIYIRPVTETDLLTVYEQICELESFVFDINAFEIIFLNNIKDKNKLYYLATAQDGSIIGYISCHLEFLLHHCGKVAEIQELFVKKEARNQGIGQQLVIHTQKVIESLGCVSFEVTAQNKRLNTHHFYQKIGFNSTHLKFTKNI